MKMSKIHVALLLAGLATGVSAQTSVLQSTAADTGRTSLQADRGGLQLAQASGTQGAGSGGQSGREGRGHRRGPPPEAIAACKGKASGAACSFTGRRGEALSGTCFAPPPRAESGTGGQAESPPLACRPQRSGQRGGAGGQGGPGKGPGG